MLALVASTNGVSKHELLSSVYGYADRFRDASQRVALDRQFERDKEQLRQLGIPVETIESPGEPGNNQLMRYRISKAALQVPEGLAFNDRELMMLRMAALAWREGSLTDEARRAAMKLESLGAGSNAPSLGVSAGFGMSEPSAPALLAAIESGRIAEFAYQLPSRETPLARRVYPLQLHRFEGRWHLIAHDLDRTATRVFLLARISGPVVVRDRKGSEADFPDDAAALVERSLSELRQLQHDTPVRLRVRPGSFAELRFSPNAERRELEDGSSELTFGSVDLRELAVLIASYGSEAEVLEPAILRDAVAGALRRVADMHGGLVTQFGGQEGGTS